MRVFFFTEGTAVSPASRIRVYEYLVRYRGDGPFQARPVSFTSGTYCRHIVAGVRDGLGLKFLEKFYQLWAVLRLVAGAITCDVLFIQRVLLPVCLQKLVRFLNPRIVYDFDDAVYLGARARGARFSSQVRLASRVVAVSRAAKLKALEAGSRPEKTAVLPSPVECSAYRAVERSAGEIFTVGWIGSPATTFFLEEIWPELESFGKSFPETRFLFIGAGLFATGELKTRTSFEHWSPHAERELLSYMDVGLMPLRDDDWCRGKGGYKLIQYMAAGVGCLASPVGANLEIVVDGETGFFVRPGEWESFLRRLIADRPLAENFGRRGRMRALELYDYSVTAPQFFAVLEEAGRS